MQLSVSNFVATTGRARTMCGCDGGKSTYFMVVIQCFIYLYTLQFSLHSLNLILYLVCCSEATSVKSKAIIMAEKDHVHRLLITMTEKQYSLLTFTKINYAHFDFFLWLNNCKT